MNRHWASHGAQGPWKSKLEAVGCPWALKIWGESLDKRVEHMLYRLQIRYEKSARDIKNVIRDARDLEGVRVL